ncbi:RNA polymerase II C-terminal domain phosphatase-like 5 [Cardamine amara subsp. amara]|uniref:RNA polymerase II C-terminal domain phosphatase-like n=1 Tax=Cardamine amara subsp. amara TaxID=228776 RepID=A0ABD1A8D4_CARAN
MAFKKYIFTQLVHLSKKRKVRNYKLNEEDSAEKKKKLHLVLDLDHTLVHSVPVSELSKEEKYLIEEIDSRLDLWMTSYDYITKIRPFVPEFLREANKLFTMHLYTMGSSDYVENVLKLIDPNKVYFGNRVITREESPDRKTLALLIVDKRRVVIVDDRSDVWPYDKRNLLQISMYLYFRVIGYITMSKSYAEEKKDENRCNGSSLANVLKLLENAHKRFQEEEDLQDLRLLIPNNWGE